MLDKAYMLKAVRLKLQILEHTYECALNDTTVDGKHVTQSGGRCLRSRIKRNICILELVYHLLLNNNSIVDEDAIIGFEKLIGE